MQQSSELVKGMAREAIRRAGRAGKLAEMIEQEVGRTYNYRTISGWARGESMPPADALIAAARATGLSVDQFLFGEDAGLHEQIRRLGDRVKQLEDERQDERQGAAATDA